MKSVPLHDRCWKDSNAGKMFWSSSVVVTMSQFSSESVYSQNHLLFRQTPKFLTHVFGCASNPSFFPQNPHASFSDAWAALSIIFYQCYLPFSDCLVIPCFMSWISVVKPLWRVEWIMTSLTHKGVWSLKLEGTLRSYYDAIGDFFSSSL